MFPVVHQDGIANLDTFVADIHPPGTLRRIRDECIHLVLGFAAKRTSEDFILAALEKHKPIMPRERRKSRSAKVQIRLLIELVLYGFNEDRKMLPLSAKRLLAFGQHFGQI